ncbi:MAG TPA: thiamine-phosphate kinase, partial [Chloroflexota bacterium]|nr:thiamine-phosphate kinase [Chloroflexota bacterium]
LTGGDDYEILFTVPAESAACVVEAALVHSLPLHEIGSIGPGNGTVTVVGPDRWPIVFDRTGWTHY